MISDLLDKYGACRTMRESEARRVLPHLGAYLGTDAIMVSKAPIRGEHDWVVFLMQGKFHNDALAFLAGWDAGRRETAR